MNRSIFFKTFSALIATQILSSCVTQQPAPIEFKSNAKLNNTSEYYIAEKNDTITISTITDIPSQQRSSGYFATDIIEENKERQKPLAEELQMPITSNSERISSQNSQLDKELNDVLESDFKELHIAEKTAPKIMENIKSKPTEHVAESMVIKKVDSKFINPVNGNIVKRFDNQHQGINIAANLGDEVKAISNGAVMYSGYDQKFGNLIIIKLQEEGLFVAFAYLDDLLVNKGENVTQGQIIGHIGQSGETQIPQLYLAIKQGKTALDPELYLNY
jgi:septal ring factor EnvC (AmiA/AmiB activator)